MTKVLILSIGTLVIFGFVKSDAKFLKFIIRLQIKKKQSV
jgi:hypothetical protein